MISDLRTFIREVAKEEVAKRSLEEPKGYTLWDEDYYSEDRREDGDEIGTVNIKTDDGYLTPHPREALRELRTFVRLSLEKALAESKKKMLKSDEDEDEDDKKKKKKKPSKEASGTSAVAGYTGPMSAPANARKFYSDMEKAYHGKIVGPIPTRKP